MYEIFEDEDLRRFQKSLTDGPPASYRRCDILGGLLRIAIDETPKHCPGTLRAECAKQAPEAVAFWGRAGFDQHGNRAIESASRILRAFCGTGLNAEGHGDALLHGFMEAIKMKDLDQRFPRVARYLKGIE